MDPAGVRSAYRLTLRAISASVMHQSRSTHAIRRLYGPTFRGAAQVAQALRDDQLQPAERTRLTGWLRTWNARVDETLKMLLNSAQSHGLTSKITRNLSHIQCMYMDIEDYRISRTHGEWDSQRPDEDRQRLIPKPKAVEKKKEEREIEDKGWGPLSQVILMAENTAGVHLGRLTFNKEMRRLRGKALRR
ncbi:hypothetical protein EXIGLDRAFT_776311 [Exidia glandulosa HHB12029]|uniref:Uncharacterized protein n=1 Tax=Exidia glandulosa HHB12029 TaxID=1314781 RepID=A0A165DIS1_EXIGL|nr:hypothetical protein EXIGLDRAFT_776311 [Exidia glandulosa HHB12029]